MAFHSLSRNTHSKDLWNGTSNVTVDLQNESPIWNTFCQRRTQKREGSLPEPQQ